MGKETGIQWCNHTFNPWRGCARVSDGCMRCYAETLSHRNPGTLGVWGVEKAGGTRVVAAESYWRQAFRWHQEAREAGVRRRVFTASLADVFEDWRGPMVDSQGRAMHLGAGGAWFNAPTPSSRPLTMDDVRERLFGLIGRTPNLDWLLLTKRPENVLPTLERLGNTSAMVDCWLTETTLPQNIWLGVSCEDQAAADDRIPVLLSIPAAVRWVSAEPLLGPIDFRRVQHDGTVEIDALTGDYGVHRPLRGRSDSRLSWIIAGGESGPRRRPMELAWLESIADQCRDADVPLYVKQDSALRDGQQGRVSDELWAVKQFPVPAAG